MAKINFYNDPKLQREEEPFFKKHFSDMAVAALDVVDAAAETEDERFFSEDSEIVGLIIGSRESGEGFALVKVVDGGLWDADVIGDALSDVRRAHEGATAGFVNWLERIRAESKKA